MSVLTQNPTLMAAMQEIARHAKSHEDIAAIQQELYKQTLETCLKAELDNHTATTSIHLKVTILAIVATATAARP